ncbi:MAG: cation-translocating P-type ATPase [Candidatus Margulisbacteria bacterium]|nr:cation-translocating P-type ATPase [Candidatus Margulisiibacteriota bacterium]
MSELIEHQGLSENEAAERLKKEGPNELPSQKKQSVLAILFNVIKEPMLLLLIVTGVIYAFLGELKDALMLSTFVFVIIGITFYQERRTERTLEALRDLSSPRALVIRDGAQKRIAGREVVRGDLIVLREGDRVPADAEVLSCSNLSADESLLTGEAFAVIKSDRDQVYSGTLIVQGHGLATVTATGLRSELGKIGRSLEQIHEENTLLQKETGKIVRNFTIAGIILCLLVAVIYTLNRGNWLQGFLAGLTLSMAMLPEEFPVVLLIFLTLGAWRISKSQVLTRNKPAIETLGAATCLCVDKTGTLTMNRMKLAALLSDNTYLSVEDQISLPEASHDVLEYGILASQKDPFDPIEKEVRRLGELYLSGTEHIHNNWQLVKEYTLSKQLLALSHVWESPDKQNYIIAAKGAPEAIADLCHFDRTKNEELTKKVEQMSKHGLRVLGVAKAVFIKTDLPPQQHDFAFEFIGLLGFIDPVRPGVPDSVKEAHAAGLRVIMITGDYPGTAQFIARQIGLKEPENIITGPELETLDEKQLAHRIKTVNVFARVVPEQKLLIVKALKANHEVVAMTGDGVNDAPALKAAHIGIAMGERGTDVAREASDLVLLNDDFSSIVAAVRLGRRIFENLKKAISYIFSVHVPIAGMSLLPVLFQLPIVLLPAHIAFLELVIDPACSTVFEAEPEEKHIMKRPPRKLNEPLFSRRAFMMSLLQGLSVLAVVFFIFIWGLYIGKGEAEARTLAFTSLVFANLMLIFTNLSWTQNVFRIVRAGNRALWFVTAGTMTALILVLYLPVLRDLFHFQFMHLDDLTISLVGGIVSLAWFEGLKSLGKYSA